MKPEIVWTDMAVDFIASSLYAIHDRNKGDRGFAQFHHLPEWIKLIWRDTAKDWLREVIPMLTTKE